VESYAAIATGISSPSALPPVELHAWWWCVSLDDRRRTLDLIAAVKKMVLVHTLHDRYDHRVRKKGDYQDDRPQLTNVVTLLISRGAGQAM
jgi:hypothetical protein